MTHSSDHIPSEAHSCDSIPQDADSTQSGRQPHETGPQDRLTAGAATNSPSNSEPLRYSDHRWLRRIARGFAWLAAGAAGAVLVPVITAFVATARGPSVWGHPAVRASFTAAFSTMAMGVWLATIQEPGQLPTWSIDSRRLLRLNLFVQSCLVLGLLLLTPKSDEQIALALCSGIGLTCMVACGTGQKYVLRLARRIPDPELAKTVGVAWRMVFHHIKFSGMTLLPGLIWLLSQMLHLRKRLLEAAEQAQTASPADSASQLSAGALHTD